jgi:polyisoprenoid-binding protein YceI
MSHQHVVWFLALVWLLLVTAANKLQAQGEVSISFVIANAGIDVSGTIGGIQTDVRFDPQNPAAGMVRITAAPSTLHTGIDLRDKHLQQKEYFDTDRYPYIVMQSRSFRRTGRNRFTGTFDLTIRNITRSVTVDSGKVANEGMRYEGRFEINRLDFEVGEPSIVLDDIVKVAVQVVM